MSVFWFCFVFHGRHTYEVSVYSVLQWSTWSSAELCFVYTVEAGNELSNCLYQAPESQVNFCQL